MITCKFEDGGDATLRHTVVDGILVKDNKVLLIRRAKNLIHGGKLALPGGYLDRNETIFDAVRREVKEETGYEIKNPKLFNIISDPSRKEDRQNVAFVFIVEVGEQTGKPDKEVDGMAWYDLEKLPAKEETAFDHHEVLDLYKKYREKKFDLPIVS